MKVAFSDRLKMLRKRKGLTVRQAAEAVGVPVSTYRDWEYGKAIRGEPYSKLAKAFEVSLSELLDEPRECPSLVDHLTAAQAKIDIAIKIAKALL